ncbi:dynactin subunit 5-like [Convolutriloba macropyga]|uniref:dynactin subunit 5-like n=1 Tax=Convolutriloba macropyga TaxID=536237 RepID=UPI003F51E861
MELPERTYISQEYIETASGNKVCRNSVLCGSQNIILNGKSIIHESCIIRGDLAGCRFGRNCVISERSVIRPPSKRSANKISFIPVQIGDCVYVEEDVILQATSVGSYVHIGKGSVIGKRAKLGDCSAILPGSYVPPDTVVPTFAIFGGSPARWVDDLPETQQYLMNEACREYYSNFKPVSTSS